MEQWQVRYREMQSPYPWLQSRAETLASTYISGTVEGDSMKGYFIRSDSSGKATRGEFTATLISPDTSGYTPAVIQTVSTSFSRDAAKNR